MSNSKRRDFVLVFKLRYPPIPPGHLYCSVCAQENNHIENLSGRCTGLSCLHNTNLFISFNNIKYIPIITKKDCFRYDCPISSCFDCAIYRRYKVNRPNQEL